MDGGFFFENRGLVIVCMSVSIHPISETLAFRPALAHARRKTLEHRHRRLPADASVRDTHALLQRRRPFCRHLLRALVDVALDHHAHDARVAGCDLRAHGRGDLGLVAMVLQRVAMTAVDHDGLALLLGAQSVARAPHARGVEIRPRRPAPQDHEAMLVPGGSRDGGKALFRHAHEVVAGGRGANGVDGDAQTAVGAVLEAHGEGEARGQFAVQLGFGGAGANGAKRDEVGEELRGDGVEHLRGDGDAGGGEIAE